MKRTLPLMMICALAATPAYACLEVSPTVRAWAQCAYEVTFQSNDHRFMKSMAEAKWLEKKLKNTSQERWSEVEERIVKVCGPFADARAKDLDDGKDVGSMYVPKDQFEAIADTSDIDKRVKL